MIVYFLTGPAETLFVWRYVTKGNNLASLVSNVTMILDLIPYDGLEDALVLVSTSIDENTAFHELV